MAGMADEEPTTGQRVDPRLLVAASLGTDSTISAQAATPELVAQGLAEIERETARERAAHRRGSFDPHGVTHDAPPRPDGTLDLPVGDQVASAGALDPGQIIGHFVIRKRLGEGGMGMVLAGEDPDLGRPVAIKVVKDTADHPAYRDRLLREAKVMARLEHPNIVRVYEVGSDRGRLFVAMELVDGVTLAAWLALARRGWRDILAMFQQVGAGLSAVHHAGLVHRDFKPDNLLVDRTGRARVADFGLARLDPDSSSDSTPALGASLTRTGMRVGTPAYMAPEQHYGGDVDARADQYSFCVSLREALIGSRPIKIEDAHWGDVPRPMRAAIARGAAVDVNERWASMDELLAALAKGAGRRRVWLGLAAAGVLLVGGGIGVAAVLGASSDTADRGALTSRADQPTESRMSREPARVPSPEPARVPSPEPVPPEPVPPEPVPLTTEHAPAPLTPEQARAPLSPGAPPSPGRPTADKRVATDKPVADKRVAATDTSAPGGTATNPTGPTKVGDTLITPMTPVRTTDAAKKHNVEGDAPKHEMIAAHRSAVRDALHDFGFLGVTMTGTDRDADQRELEDQLAAATDDFDRGKIRYALGLNERARDNCAGALGHWAAARKLMAVVSREQASGTRHDQAFLFLGRAQANEAYCSLLGGRALGLPEKLQNALISMWASKGPERAEVQLAWAIALYETGEEEHGKELLLLAASNNDKLRPAISAYAQAVGLKF
jgi:serine/threonine protein kinase